MNALYAAMDDNSNFALTAAMTQAGVKLKAVVFLTGYEPSAVHSAAWSSLQGDYFDSTFRPFQLPDAATRQMQRALIEYDHFSSSRFDEYDAWVGADLMIHGIQAAGSDPTLASIIKALRNTTAYNGGGLEASSITYSTIFGHDLPKQCG